MTSPRGVRTADARGLAAVAELPASARVALGVEGSIVVITGEVGWGSRLRRAIDDGAAGIVLADPLSVSVDEAGEAGRAARGGPGVIERPRRRAEVALD